MPIDQTLKLNQNQCVSSKFEVETDKACRVEMESPVKVRNDEERSEVDGGLGTSVCGEDIANNANLAESAAANQIVPGNIRKRDVLVRGKASMENRPQIFI